MATETLPARSPAVRATGAWRWPAIRSGPATVLLALFLGIAALQSLVVDAIARSRGFPSDLRIVVFGHLTGALGAWIALPAVQTAVANAPDVQRGWARLVAIHLTGYAAFLALQGLVMVSLRAIVLTAVGAPRSPFGAVGTQLAWEAQADLILYTALAGLWYAIGTWEERRDAALRQARLERALAETRLDALTARLDPHFLFNALHTIGAVMHEDLGRTERLLASLGEILRATLRPDASTWTVREEREHTERYLEIVTARFGDRIVAGWTHDAASDAFVLPRFAIQSLVENVVKHNDDVDRPIRIEIDLRADADGLTIDVDDDGVGFRAPLDRSDGASPRGLARLEESLALLFGAGATLTRARSARGGARVSLRVPTRQPLPAAR